MRKKTKVKQSVKPQQTEPQYQPKSMNEARIMSLVYLLQAYDKTIGQLCSRIKMYREAGRESMVRVGEIELSLISQNQQIVAYALKRLGVGIGL